MYVDIWNATIQYSALKSPTKLGKGPASIFEGEFERGGSFDAHVLQVSPSLEEEAPTYWFIALLVDPNQAFRPR